MHPAARILVVKHEAIGEDLIRPLVEEGAGRAQVLVLDSEDTLDDFESQPGDVLILAVAPGDVPAMLERLGNRRPDLPVVVLTGGKAASLASGPAEYLSRTDMSSESIARAVQHVSERYRFHAAEEALGRARRRLDSARRVQQHLFPKPLHRLSLDMWGAVQSRDVSGDFYDFLELPDGRLLVVLGDVTGHGLDASLLMATARAYARAIISLTSVMRAADILLLLNRMLLDDVGDERFVALSLGLLDGATGRLDYAAAGQPPAYVVNAEGESRIIDSPLAVPLGIQPESVYEGVTVSLVPGDRLLMVTDGLLEAMSPAGEPFGEENLRSFLRSQQGRSAQETVVELQQQIARFTASQTLRDDITLVVVRLLPSS